MNNNQLAEFTLVTAATLGMGVCIFGIIVLVWLVCLAILEKNNV